MMVESLRSYPILAGYGGPPIGRRRRTGGPASARVGLVGRFLELGALDAADRRTAGASATVTSVPHADRTRRSRAREATLETR